jgi:hypothetical protein
MQKLFIKKEKERKKGVEKKMDKCPRSKTLGT